MNLEVERGAGTESPGPCGYNATGGACGKRAGPHDRAARRGTAGGTLILLVLKCGAGQSTVLSNRWCAHEGQSTTDSKIIK